MFYQKGIDITNDRQMFEFLKGHFEYPTMSSWNQRYSIANNVKLYKLGLSGDWGTVSSHLEDGEYDVINYFIQEWKRSHNGYEVYFNGRSNGYLVLKDRQHNGHILPESILDSETYEDYKEWCRENCGSVKANRSELVVYTKLVQDFDKLCDELRDFCDQLSKLSFEVTAMQQAVENFNCQYADDLELLGFSPLVCDDEGVVDVSEIIALRCLSEAFMKKADYYDNGYKIVRVESCKLKLEAR